MILETYPQFLSETPIFWLFDGWMEPSLSFGLVLLLPISLVLPLPGDV
jgi:hypothetical protein